MFFYEILRNDCRIQSPAQRTLKTYRIYKKPFKRVIDLVFGKKNYTEYKALNKINVEIGKGEAVGVLGKNGAGKSTLLKIITGVVKPTEGSVDIKGKISAILELNSGFDQELTGLENIYVKGAILGYKKEEIDKKLNDIIEFADIGDYIHQPVRTYSSGMKARLGFAISVNVDPDVLIVDEALAVGDDIFKTKCLTKMSEFRRAGKTIFFVSHSLYTVASFCTKCMWIKNGELIDYGPTQEVLPKYETFLKEEKALEKKKKISSGKKVIEKKDFIEIKNFKFESDGKFGTDEDIVYSFDYIIKQEMGLEASFNVEYKELEEVKYHLKNRNIVISGQEYLENVKVFVEGREEDILKLQNEKLSERVELKDFVVLKKKYIEIE